MSVDIIHGDCMDALQYFRSDSFDSCVTDPPYNLESIKRRFSKSPRSEKTENTGNPYGRTGRGFMGKTWDSDVAFQSEMWAEVYRVLKPGAHVLAFGGSRTYHRLASAIEDAGFEIRDQIMWLYGSGFPKSHNLDGDWQGWGTALKPAHEPIVLARKPLIGTVAANVAAWGVGAVNIDGCRVPFAGEANEAESKTKNQHADFGSGPMTNKVFGKFDKDRENYDPTGRFPANVVHDGSDEVLAGFPDSNGSGPPRLLRRSAKSDDSGWGMNTVGPDEVVLPDAGKGSAARFFYCAKASRSDRNDGLAEFAKKPLLWSAGTKNPGSFQSEGTEKAAQNPHPTVKPTDLMRYLCRLITPPGGHVLDPYLGSGSTGRGAVMEGFDFTGIELTEEYVPIARARIAAVQPQDIFA
jgi:site-specific DNA-methyltransferase (adenine-specific)